MRVEYRMPALGADMDSGTVVQWHVQPGSRVKRGDVVGVVETDKGAIDVEIFEDGVVAELLVQPGTKVPVGTPPRDDRGGRQFSPPSLPVDGSAPSPALAGEGRGHCALSASAREREQGGRGLRTLRRVYGFHPPREFARRNWVSTSGRCTERGLTARSHARMSARRPSPQPSPAKAGEGAGPHPNPLPRRRERGRCGMRLPHRCPARSARFRTTTSRWRRM